MRILDDALLRQTIRRRPADSYKGTYGRVVLIGGSQQYGGAILMATMAAVASGAGLVTTVTDPVNLTSLHSQVPEAMFADWQDSVQLQQLVASATVVVIGPGLGETPQALTCLQRVLTTVTPNQQLVIDGSAITLMARHRLPTPKARVTFTPHQMEWQRLSGIPIAEQTIGRNQPAVATLQATVVLKSHHTHIYTANQVFENPGGTPAQATGGMGDTLAGMIGGFQAQFKESLSATLAAVYTHSVIADELAMHQYVVLPHQIVQRLPTFMFEHQAAPESN